MSRCAGCRQPIEGRYLQALAGVWHPGCFVCHGCGRVIAEASFSTHKGRPYHSRCYQGKFSPPCVGCGTWIVGAVVTVQGQTWHPHCFRCALCGEPIGGGHFIPGAGGPRHLACHHRQNSPPCVICGGTIRTAGYLTNGWGESYCDTHIREYPPCASCGRLIAPRLTGGGLRYADRRTVCQRCRRTAIDTVEQGRRTLLEVRKWLSDEGMALGEETIPLRLVGQHELSELAGSATRRRPAGLTRTQVTTRNGGVIQRDVRDVSILYGLPQEQFATILAHEFCHVWLFRQEFIALPPMIEEGLCTLGEYLWLRRLETPEAAYRLRLLHEEKDPVYGAGFQAAKKAFDRLALPDLLAFVRHRGRFPYTNPLARLLGVM